MSVNRKLFVTVPAVVLGFALSSCSGSSNDNSKEASLFAAAASQKQKLNGDTAESTVVVHDCNVPALIAQNPAKTGKVVDVGHLPQEVSGTFDLDELLLFSTQASSSGSKPDIVSTGVQIQLKPDGQRNTQLQYYCDQSEATSDILTQSIAAVLVVHFPSGRVTVYDQGNSLDVPQTNYPTFAQLTADASGKDSFTMTKDKTPPFTTDLTFSAWVGLLPSTPTFTVLSDGSFEARVHWTNGTKSAQDSSAYFHFKKRQ